MGSSPINNNKMKYIKIAAVAIISTASNCEKKPTAVKMPNEYFVCDIEGPNGYLEYSSAIGHYNSLSDGGVDAQVSYKYNSIEAITSQGNRNFYFTINSTNTIIGIHKANEYVLSGYPSLMLDPGSFINGEGWYNTIDSLPATITITKFTGNPAVGSKTNDVIEGTFDMWMIASQNKKIHLKNGKFRVIAE